MKAHLANRARALRPAKVLFVRRRDRRSSEGIRVFWARSAERESTLSTAVVEDYAHLLALDFAEPGDPAGHPLFLVCVHGKHDACCARHGLPLYRAVRERLEDGWVWQCSHIGGDRFAGNLVCLPDGVYYGRVRPEDVGSVLDEHLAGRVQLGLYRGRSCYPFPVQAAERAVREASGVLDLDGLELRSTSPVRFRAGRRDYELEVVRGEGELARLTCNAEGLSHPQRYAARILRESGA